MKLKKVLNSLTIINFLICIVWCVPIDTHKVNNNTSLVNKKLNSQQNNKHRHKLTSSSHSSSSTLSKNKAHKKRCHYSDNEIVNDEKNHQQNIYKARRVNDLNNSNTNQRFVKQPKVRDQFNNMHRLSNNDNHFRDEENSQNLNEINIEKEILFVNQGDRVNLTCHIHAREIDWHFKDRNLTTTVLSYGLQLQVAQPVLFELNEPVTSSSLSLFENDYNDDFESGDASSASRMQRSNTAYAVYNHHPTQIYKYKVSSDRELTHVLTLYVQGVQDEGSYQCIDSKSENPIKKTIYVYLSKSKTN
jgi:hypothetical protein